MKVVNVDDVLKILHKYGKYVFVTDKKKYSTMVDEIANLKALKPESILDKIRAEIMKLQTYKMFDGEDAVYVECEDVLQIIDKYKAESEVQE
jgi:uncharacterized protein YqgQ